MTVNYYRTNENDVNQGELETFKCEGIHTNEAVTKYLITTLADNEQKLDYIISLKSEKVREGKIPGEEVMTHGEFYENAVAEYVSDENLDDKYIPEFKGIEISNVPENEEIERKVLEISQEIEDIWKESKGDCTIYIDYTGGDRTSATMIIALTKMLESRNINGIKVLAVNYDPSNSEDKPSSIGSKTDINYIFDIL